MKVKVIPIWISKLDTVKNWLAQGLEEIANKRTNEDYMFVEIDQNTEKSLGGLMILAVTQIPQTLVWETLK